MYVNGRIIMGAAWAIFVMVIFFTTFPPFARFTGLDKHAGEQIKMIEKVSGKGQQAPAAGSGSWISATTPVDFEAASGQLTFGMPLSQVKGLAKPAGTGSCSLVGVAEADATGKARTDALMLLCENVKKPNQPIRRMFEGSLVDARSVSFGVQLAKRSDQWVLPKGTVLNFQVSKEAKK